MATQKDTQLVERMFEFSRIMKGKLSISSDFAHLSMLQLQTLIFLAENPNITMSNIAAHFSIELPSATSLINKLHKVGLVERKPDKNDRRKICIVLTQKGVQLLKEGKKIRSQKMEKVLSFLSDSEKETMQKILEKMISSIGGTDE